MQYEPLEQATSRYGSVDELERHLARASAAFDGSRLVADDEAERFPSDACAALDDFAYYRYYVPTELGGAWCATDELVHVLRAVARRDLSVAIAHAKTFLGAAPVWVAGDERQRRRLARLVLDGKAVALGLTERAHGADLAASEVVARATPRGFELFGEKWLINNGTRGAAITVLARTSDDAGPSSMSVFLVEKSLLPAKTFQHHAKIPTLGIRGADISGIAFDGAPVSLCDCVGGVGRGLEVTLKTLQLTRTLCCGLSLGAADSALRMSARFARDRRLYSGSVLELPSARAKLLGAYADLLLAECVALAGARSLHTAPEQASFTSALVKYLVPTLVDDLIDDAAVILGARHYLRGSYCSGLFQKLQRDHRLVALFDGSTMVNLSSLSVQLQRLNREPSVKEASEAARRLVATFDLRLRLPAFERAQLCLVAPTGNDVLDALDDPKLNVPAALHEEVGALRKAVAQVRAEVQRLARAGGPWHQSAHAYELARRYALLHAAGCCLHFWLYSRATLASGFGADVWVRVCMARARTRALGSPSAGFVEEPLALAELLLGQLARGESFSILGGAVLGSPYARVDDAS